MSKIWTISVLICLLLTGCTSSAPDVTGSSQSLAMRAIQTREYDTLDKDMTMRSIIATLQDLGFIIDNADAAISTVTATRYYQHERYQNYIMKITVTVRERDGKRVAVRANARVNDNAVEKPETYQDFFTALDKSMFLTLHKVD